MKRRDFIKASAVAGAGLTMTGVAPAILAGSPNETVRVAMMGVVSRGGALAQSVAKHPHAEIAVVCDVDERAIASCIEGIADLQERVPVGEQDIRRVVERTDIDALVIAAPDHWHAPAAIMAMQNGKHVYVEKPCSHNPQEGELLVEAQRKYGRVVQMGNQQRSAPRSIEAIGRIRAGDIGTVQRATCWYANTRGGIGHGKTAAVPAWLDYELWQGPAPRRPFRDNLIHYNWHWFWHWGTGEINNNGAHELDVCRWALGVDFPTRVTSHAGRHHYDDDWEFYDTQVASYTFADGSTISWDGKSCNGMRTFGRGRGAAIYGTGGTMIVDRGGYMLYDLAGDLVEENLRPNSDDPLDTRGGGPLTDLHFANFFDAIRTGAPQHSPIDEGHKSTLLCHLGNIAQENGGQIMCDPSDGHIVGNFGAEAMWSRTYEPGWEPTV